MNVVLPMNARPRRLTLAGLAGEPPTGCVTVNNAQTCGYWGMGPAPAYYTAGAAQAAQLGYSIPINSVDCGMGVCVQCANPDGTVTTVWGWNVYPPSVGAGAGASAVDTSFVPPPQSVWNQYLISLGVQTMAQQQAANNAAALAAAQQDCAASGGTWNSGSQSCAPPSAAATTLSAQQACLAQGLPWNPATGACGTPPTSSAGSSKPPSTPPPSSTGTSAAKLTFTMPRTPAQVGDQWLLKITGATPGAMVTVYGVHPDGTTATNGMGTVASDGTFSLSGTFDTSTEGTWTETWYVGTQQVGTPFSFTVGIPSSSAGTGNQGSGGSTSFGVNSTYVIGGAVGLLALVLLMGGKR